MGGQAGNSMNVTVAGVCILFALVSVMRPDSAMVIRLGSLKRMRDTLSETIDIESDDEE